ncbi:MAG TPA: hypothetical protein VF221_17880 [Chloroflexota bacterium]
MEEPAAGWLPRNGIRRSLGIVVLNYALYAALRLAAWALQFVPIGIVYAAARCVGWCAYYVVLGARRSITANLAVVMGMPGEQPKVRHAARHAFQHDAMNWIDTLRISRLSPSEILDMVHVDEWQLLEDTVREGRGVVLVTLHLGNYDLVGQVLVARGYQLTVAVEHMEPARLFDFLMSQRTSKGINAVPIEHAPRELIRALRAGEIVGLAGDRNIVGRVLSVQMFGRQADLPLGPVSLARHTGANVLLGVGIRTRSGGFQGKVRRIPLVHTDDAEADDARNLSTLAAEMENLIGCFPDQWLAFRPFWANHGASATATMRQQNRAILHSAGRDAHVDR